MTYNEFLKNNRVGVKFIEKLANLYDKFSERGAVRLDQWRDEELINCYAVTKRKGQTIIITCFNEFGDCYIDEFNSYAEFHEMLKDLEIVED